MKEKNRFISVITKVLAIAMFVVSVPSCASATPSAPDGLNDISEYIQASETISADERLGVPVNLYTYYDDTKDYEESKGNANVVMYVINTKTERLGKNPMRRS